MRQEFLDRKAHPLVDVHGEVQKSNPHVRQLVQKWRDREDHVARDQPYIGIAPRREHLRKVRLGNAAAAGCLELVDDFLSAVPSMLSVGNAPNASNP